MMAPWIETAQRRISIPVATFARASDITKHLWIYWDLECITSMSNGTLSISDVEAMELLELYARVDYREAWKMILKATKGSLYLEELMDATAATGEKLFPRFSITSIDVPLMKRQLVRTFKQLVLRIDPQNHSDWYFHARETLLQHWADHHGGVWFQRCPGNLVQIQIAVKVDDFMGKFVFEDRRVVHESFSQLGNQEVADEVLGHLSAMVELSQDPKKLSQFPEWQMRNEAGLPVRVSDVYRIESVDINFAAIYPSEEMLQLTERMLVTSGICVNAVRVARGTYNMYQLNRQSSTSFFRTLLVGSNDAKPPSIFHLGDNVHFGVFQGACSALMANTSIRAVTIELPGGDIVEVEHEDVADLHEEAFDFAANQYPDSADDDDQEDESEEEDDGVWEEYPVLEQDHRLFWSWIAYSLFSREATHRIQHLELVVLDLRQSHIRAFERVLKARDPLAFIPRSKDGPYRLPTATKASREPAVVEVAPHSKVYMTSYKHGYKQTSNQIEALRVVHDSVATDKDFVRVVYPGTGVCWVSRSDIIARHTISLPVSRAQTIRRLKLKLHEDTSVTALLRLIKLIGGELESLTLEALNPLPLAHAVFQRIFAVCPRLVHLELRKIIVVNFDWLTCYGARLESMSLVNVVSEQEDGYTRLVAAQSSSPTQVKEMHVHAVPSSINAMVPSVVQMLKTSRKIERFFFTIDSQEGQTRVHSGAVHALLKCHNIPLNIQKSPLSLRCKLAVLSATIDGSHDATPDEHEGDNVGPLSKRQRIIRLPELSETILATIFEFAASNKHRVCGFLPSPAMW